mgnify:CR=1 FL=1
MITKEALTKIFLSQWNKSIDDANVALYMRKWWQSNRSNQKNGFRLSDDGFEFLAGTLDLTSYEIPFNESIELSPQTIIFLDRYLDCPYYLTYRSIIVFSEKRSFELYMFSDDIRKYGLVKAMNARLNDQNNG